MRRNRAFGRGSDSRRSFLRRLPFMRASRWWDQTQIATPLACSLALEVAAVLLTACNPSAPAADPPLADPYDVGKMTLQSAPAKVSAKRHKGPFAEGSSLSV